MRRSLQATLEAELNSDEESDNIIPSKKQKIETNPSQEELALPSEFKIEQLPPNVLSTILKYYVDGDKLLVHWNAKSTDKDVSSLFESIAKKWYPGLNLSKDSNYHTYLKRRIESDFKHTAISIPYFMDTYNRAFTRSIGNIYTSLNTNTVDLDTCSAMWSELQNIQVLHEIRSKRIEVFVKDGEFPSATEIFSTKDSKFLKFWWSYNIYFTKYDFQEDKETIEGTSTEESIVKWSCTFEMFTVHKTEPFTIGIEIEKREVDEQDTTGTIKLSCTSLSSEELFSVSIDSSTKEEDEDSEEEEEEEDIDSKLDERRVAELLKSMGCAPMSQLQFLRTLLLSVMEDNAGLQEFVEEAFDRLEGDTGDGEEDL